MIQTSAVALLCVLIVMLFSALLFRYIGINFKIGRILSLSNMIFYLFIRVFVLMIIFFVLAVMIIAFYASNLLIIKLVNMSLSFLISKLNPSTSINNLKDLSMYLSVTFILIISAYAPEKIGYWLIWFPEKIITAYPISRLYEKVIKLLRLKLLMYLTAFLLIFTTTLSSYIPELAKLNILVSIKSVIYPSFATFLALDKFISMLKPEEVTKIKQDLKRFVSWFTYTRNNNDDTPSSLIE